jgi:hypothetical protein
MQMYENAARVKQVLCKQSVALQSTDYFLKFLYYTSFLTPHDLNFRAANAINACISILLPKGEKCGVLSLRVWRCNAMLSREKIRLKVKFSSIKKPPRISRQVEDITGKT